MLMLCVAQFNGGENSNCWNAIGAQQNFNQISNDNQMNTNLISWTPMIQPQAYIQQNNSVGDDSYKNIVLVGSTVSDNNFSNYAMIQPSYQNGRNYWSSPDNFEYLIAKDKDNTFNQQPLYSDVKIPSQRINNEIFTQNGNKYINSISIPQNQCVVISDNCIKNIDGHLFPKQWLVENFQRVDEECTIARSLMYGYYVYACFLRRETPMNSAGLGKIIRSVYGNIKNRRLGARGDSRYHYLGIKIIETSYILNIPSNVIDDIVLKRLKCAKNTSKLLQKNDFKNSESSNETNDIFNNIDTTKLKNELKYFEELEKKPLHCFSKTLNDIYLSFNKDELHLLVIDEDDDDNKLYEMHKLILKELGIHFNNLELQINKQFKMFNESGLFDCIQIFWSNEQIISLCNASYMPNGISLNDNKNDCQDNHHLVIERCILNYTKKLIFSILEKYIGNIKDNLSVEYLDKILNLFNIMKKSIECSLINYSKYFVTGMTSILIKIIEIVKEYKSMHDARIKLLNILINDKDNDQVIKMYNMCNETTFDQFIDDFHFNNSHIFHKFPINIKEFKEFYIQLAIAPLHNNSQEWLYIIEEKILKIHNSVLLPNKQQNHQLPYKTLLNDWCAYQNLFNQYISDNKPEIEDDLFLSKLSSRLIAFHEKYLNIKNQNFKDDQPS